MGAGTEGYPDDSGSETGPDSGVVRGRGAGKGTGVGCDWKDEVDEVTRNR